MLQLQMDIRRSLDLRGFHIYFKVLLTQHWQTGTETVYWSVVANPVRSCVVYHIYCYTVGKLPSRKNWVIQCKTVIRLLVDLDWACISYCAVS